MVELFCRFVLLLAQESLLIPCILLGYHCLNREIFEKATALLLFTIIFNSYLKSIWQIPLSEHLGEGWAFPSGHMSAAFVFWAWLAGEYKKPLFSIAVGLGLVAIAGSLLYFDYHSTLDILGAVFFSAILLLLYEYLCFLIPSNRYWCLFLCMMILGFTLLLLLPKNNWHNQVALGGLLILTLSSTLNTRFHFETKLTIKKLVLLTLGIALIYFSGKCLMDIKNSLKGSILFAQYLLAGFWIMIGIDLLFTKFTIIKKTSFKLT